MTQVELFTALKTLGIPIAYGSFATTQIPPFITYQFTSSDDLFADNINSIPANNFQVELYTKTKDLVKEKLIEDKFKSLELPYQKLETWIDEEKVYQILYEIQLTGG